MLFSPLLLEDKLKKEEEDEWMGGGRLHNSLQHFGNLERSFNWIVTKRASRVGCASGIYGPPLSLSLLLRRPPLSINRDPCGWSPRGGVPGGGRRVATAIRSDSSGRFCYSIGEQKMKEKERKIPKDQACEEKNLNGASMFF